MADITQEQIENWKKEYGADQVYCLELKKDGNIVKVYFKNTDCVKNKFSLMSRFMTFSASNQEMESGELILKSCYLGGLGELKELSRDSDEYISACIYARSIPSFMEGDFQLT